MLNIKVYQQFITKIVFIINAVDAHYKKCRWCKKSMEEKGKKKLKKEKERKSKKFLIIGKK